MSPLGQPYSLIFAIDVTSRRYPMQLVHFLRALGMLLTCLFFCTPSTSAHTPVFGPKTYTRTAGSPNTFQENFPVTALQGTFTIVIQNGDAFGNRRIANGNVTLNGVDVIKENDFSRRPGKIEKTITLEANNRLEIILRGGVGSNRDGPPFIVLSIVRHIDETDGPIITIEQPRPGQLFDTSPISVSGKVKDVSGVADLKVNGNSVPVTTDTFSTQVALTPGTNTITVRATDFEGNSSQVSAEVFLALARILSVSPNTGEAGQTITVAIAGQNTHFVQGTTQASFGAGISIGSGPEGGFGPVNVLSPTSATAQVQINSSAASGPRTITVRTGQEEASLANAFSIVVTGPPVISDFNPKSGPIGTLITVTGTDFTRESNIPQIILTKQGGGTILAPVSDFTSTGIGFVIPTSVTSGPLTVKVGPQSAVAVTPLTITPSSNFVLSAQPGSTTLMQGQSVSFALTLSSNNGFSRLASLAFSGLPPGLTASLTSQQITAGQISILTIAAPPEQPLDSSNFTVTASAIVDGLTVSQSANIQLNVVTPTTSFIGRTVVDDALQTPLAGVTVIMLGKNGDGGTTGCTGNTVSDQAGNFALTGLGPACVGPQLVGYDGTTVVNPAGKYAGVNLVYTLTGGQVTTSPVLVHLPRIDDKETFNVIQNAAEDQSFTYQSIPGLSLTVYKGTTFTLPDGSTPNPFPLVAVHVPVDRLPDAKPPVPTMLSAFIVAFQPANARASQPGAVFYPNTLSTAPGTNMTIMTLDPTRGRMVPYGTATVSPNGMQIVPDLDPAFPGRRFGIVNFDWHGPMPPPDPANPDDPSPGGGGGGCPPGLPSCQCADQPTQGRPVDLSSGLETVTSTDISFGGLRGTVSLTRYYRTLSTFAGPFGIGGTHNFTHRLDTPNPQTALAINLIMPDGSRFLFSRVTLATNLKNTTVPSMQGAVMSTPAPGEALIRWKDGSVFRFVSPGFLFPGVLESITDTNGNKIKVTRDLAEPRRITQITDPVGRNLSLAYDAANRITSITDPIGRLVQYSYNPQGMLATVTDPEGGITRYEYDSQNRLIKETDARGVVVAQNTYDANSRVAQQIRADGAILKFAYTYVNPLVAASPILSTVFTDTRGQTTTNRFDPVGFLTDVKDSTGQTRLVVRAAEKNNQIAAYKGTAACSTCGTAGAGDMSFEYDDQGNLLKQTDALGNTTTYTYEAVFNKVSSVRDALGNLTTFAYDPRGNLLSRTDANGKTTSYQYDANGLLKDTTDPLTNKTRFEYDSIGNLIKTTDALGNVTQFRYDGISRLVGVKDSLGRTTSTEYDKLGRVVKQIDGKGQVTTLAYDAVGNLLTLTDARGKITSFTYDAMNRLKTRTDPAGKTDTRNYDLNGNMISFTDRRGQTSTFVYDELDRLKEERYADGSVVKYSYDATGRLLQAEDSTGSTFAFEYDLAGRLLSSVGPFGTVTYQRDALGRVKRREVIGQQGVDYSYDPVGNLLSAVMPQAAVNLTYDALNRPLTINRANGVSSTHTYDPVGRLLSIVHARGATVLHSLNYSNDAAGQRTSQQASSAQALVTQPATATYDDANRLVTRAGVTFTYDANGNLTSETGPTGATNYSWDSRNRLIRIAKSDGQTIDFQYDLAGNLIQQTDTGPTLNRVQTFVLDEITNVAYQSSTDGNIFSVLTGQSIDSHWATVRSDGEVEYVLVDAINSTVVTVDLTGKVKSQFFFEPFGQTSADGNYPFKYIGRIPIGSSLYYFRARFYDSLQARFLSEDVIGFAGGINLYVYGKNNPTNFTDPSGKGWLEDLGYGECCGASRDCSDRCGPEALDDQQKACAKHDKCIKDSGHKYYEIYNEAVAKCHQDLCKESTDPRIKFIFCVLFRWPVAPPP